LRLLHALEVWREQCPEAYFLLSGGQTGGAPLSEARAMARWSLDWVVENWGEETRERLAMRLLLEEASRNTRDAARNCLALARTLGITRLGLVTDGLHMPRACHLFRRHPACRSLSLHPLPCPGLIKDYWGRHRFLRLTKMLLREGGAWLKVWAQRASGK
jgi:hypothetical protein